MVTFTTNGISINELGDLTLAQFKLISHALGNKDRAHFKNDVIANLIGSRGTKEDVDRVINS